MTNPEPRTLERLAQLLRHRHDPAKGRSFVMLMVDLERTSQHNTDELNTQPMPVLRFT